MEGLRISSYGLKPVWQGVKRNCAQSITDVLDGPLHGCCAVAAEAITRDSPKSQLAEVFISSPPIRIWPAKQPKLYTQSLFQGAWVYLFIACQANNLGVPTRPRSILQGTAGMMRSVPPLVLKHHAGPRGTLAFAATRVLTSRRVIRH